MGATDPVGAAVPAGEAVPLGDAVPLGEAVPVAAGSDGEGAADAEPEAAASPQMDLRTSLMSLEVLASDSAMQVLQVWAAARASGWQTCLHSSVNWPVVTPGRQTAMAGWRGAQMSVHAAGIGSWALTRPATGVSLWQMVRRNEQLRKLRQRQRAATRTAIRTEERDEEHCE